MNADTSYLFLLLFAMFFVRLRDNENFFVCVPVIATEIVDWFKKILHTVLVVKSRKISLQNGAYFKY